MRRLSSPTGIFLLLKFNNEEQVFSLSSKRFLSESPEKKFDYLDTAYPVSFYLACMDCAITLRLPENKIGRDFIIGDLHGCFSQLNQRLREVQFDVLRDRLFSVGDLVDRGPESLECLRLLNEPWFYATKGNHESMMLGYLRITPTFVSSSSDFINNGGDWVLSLNSSELQELQNIALNRVKSLPHQIEVAHSRLPFFVTHSGHGLYGQAFDSPNDMEEMSHRELESLLWERDFLKAELKGLNMLELKAKMLSYSLGRNQFELDHNPVVLKSAERLKHLTYAGHNSLRIPILARNHFFIDTGCGKSGRLTLIEHGKLVKNISDML